MPPFLPFSTWLLNWRTAVQIRTSGAVNSDRSPQSDLNSDLHTSLGMKLTAVYKALNPSNRGEDLFLGLQFDFGLQKR